MLITQMQKTLKTFEFLSTKNEKKSIFFQAVRAFYGNTTSKNIIGARMSAKRGNKTEIVYEIVVYIANLNLPVSPRYLCN